MSSQKLLLIDGHSLAYRAYFALPAENFSTSTGQTTNAVYGFMSMLLTALSAERPTHLAVAFDLGRQTFRLAEYPEYKAGRAKTPDDFHGQVELIKDLLGALGVPVVTKEGFEADDVLATLATQGAAAGMDTNIVSGDKDSFQLSSADITILYPKRGITDLNRMTPAAVEEKYGVSPANYRGLAALVGEKADNLPGVPGVGEKTAAKWLGLYGDLPGVLAHAEDIGGKAGGNLRDHLADVERNYRLNRLLTDLDLPIALADAEFGRIDHEALAALLDQLEFQALGKRLEVLLADLGLEGTTSPAGAGASAVEVPETAVLDGAGLLAWLADRDAEAPLGVASDARFERGSGAVDLLGLAQGEDAVAVELGELSAGELAEVATALGRFTALVMHDAKPQLKAFAQAGLDGLRVWTDTELAAYLLVPDARAYDLEALTDQHCGISLAPPETDGQGTLDLSFSNEAAQAVGGAAWGVVALAEALRAKLADTGGLGVLDEIEMPFQAILVRMELAGIAVDSGALGTLLEEFGAQAEAARDAAYEAIGHEVNLGSPKQLQVVLFEELDMPRTKRTKTGYTTDADALADLLVKTGHPFLENLLAYRDVTKLRQTVVGLGNTVADDGRIHTSYLQTVAATGRLSSKDPNLQNIPVRTEAGRRIREAFVADGDRGYAELLTADYSQIEMRIMAHLSGDEALIAAFNAGEDLHSFVGSRVFGVPTDEVTPAMRSKVKAMSYGLVYGLSAFGLSKQLRIGVEEARALMDGYFERFGAVKHYLDEVVERARAAGYTETMYGRRRYLPQLTSDRRQVREMAERAALNAPIQGSAADIMKIAMLRVEDGLRAAGVRSRMLLQVHDEIVVELGPGEYEEVAGIIRGCMGAAAELSVPLDVNVGHGRSWQDAAH
ncbi:DNA polymerase I [Brevibacterium samyangense]|uniref:DNA polymerase I n=1 Tax=Brevibacterium samyangense TaxID=366888 RepID=A0ABN2TG31_9MICO